MQIHPVVTHLNSIVSITLQPSFVGDVTDASDKGRVAAYGDPQVNLAGNFLDPVGGVFTFSFPVIDYRKGITTELANTTVRFMTQLPITTPPAVQGPLDCITSDPVTAAGIWTTVMGSRILASLTTLRAKTPAQLTSLPDATV